MGSHDDSQPKQKDENLKVYIDPYLIAKTLIFFLLLLEVNV